MSKDDQYGNIIINNVIVASAMKFINHNAEIYVSHGKKPDSQENEEIFIKQILKNYRGIFYIIGILLFLGIIQIFL